MILIMSKKVLILIFVKLNKTALLGNPPEVDGHRYTSPALVVTKF